MAFCLKRRSRRTNGTYVCEALTDTDLPSTTERTTARDRGPGIHNDFIQAGAQDVEVKDDYCFFSEETAQCGDGPSEPAAFKRACETVCSANRSPMRFAFKSGWHDLNDPWACPNPSSDPPAPRSSL